MNSENAPPLFDLEERFVTGTVVHVGAGAVTLAIKDHAVVERARVTAADLPAGRAPEDYSVGDSLPVFLQNPSESNRRFWFASARWADRAANPWMDRVPMKGEAVFGRAVQYVDTFGVFVRLESGIDAFLHVQGIPDIKGRPDIQDVVHIGDEIAGMVTAVDLERLNVRINPAELQQLRIDEEGARRLEWGGDEDEAEEEAGGAPAPMPTVPAGTNVLVVDDNPHFVNALSGALRLVGAGVTAKAKETQVGHAMGQDFVSHVVLDYGIANREALWALAKKAGKPVLVVSGAGEAARAAARREGWGFREKPVDLADMVAWLCGDAAFVPTDEEPAVDPTGLWADSSEERAVVVDASGLLAELCAETGCAGAFLARREREGVFALRAHHNLKGAGLNDLSGKLGGTVVRSVFETGDEVLLGLGPRDPLGTVAPDGAGHVFAFSLREEGEVSRVLVFFRTGSFSEATRKKLTDALPRVANLVARLGMVRYLREVETFATLGRMAGGLLHELRNLAAWAREDIEKLKIELKKGGAGGRNAGDALRRLVDTVDGIDDLVASDLVHIQKARRSRLNVNAVIGRLVKRFAAGADNDKVVIDFDPRTADLVLNMPPMVLEQPLSNLIDNAIYHVGSRSWGRISVRARLHPDDPATPLHITVEDNGDGMTAVSRTHLFRPRETVKGAKGMGMGLYVSRNLLKSVGGDLRLDYARRWYGTRFRIALPIRVGEMEAET